MWPTTAQFQRSLLAAPTVAAYVEVWNGRDKIGILEFFSASSNEEFVSGTRRSLSISIPPTRVVREMIYPGVELRPFAGLDYGGYPEVMPMGCFPLSADQFSIRADPVSLSINDRWQWIVDAPFPMPRAADPNLTVVEQMIQLIVEIGRWTRDQITVQTTSTIKVGAQTWDRDRSAAIIEMAGSIGCEVLIDRLGNPVIRTRPTGAAPVLVMAPPKRERLPDGTWKTTQGRLSNLSVLRSTAVFSAVIGVSTSSDPAVPTITYTARIKDPASPAFVPFGILPNTLRMPVTGMSARDLRIATEKKLSEVSAPGRQLQIVGAVSDPSLDAGDVFTVQWPDTPDIAPELRGKFEDAQIQSIDHAIGLQGADSQAIATVSNRTDEDLS